MKVFRELDVDGNKHVSFKELRVGLKKLGIDYSKQKIRRLFRILDPGFLIFKWE